MPKRPDPRKKPTAPASAAPAANAAPNINRRLYARFPVRIPVSIFPLPGQELKGELFDIGMGGALVRSPVPIGPAEVRCRFTLDGVELLFDAYIVRTADNPRESGLMYGLEFHPNPDMERRLKNLLPPKSTGFPSP